MLIMKRILAYALLWAARIVPGYPPVTLLSAARIWQSLIVAQDAAGHPFEVLFYGLILLARQAERRLLFRRESDRQHHHPMQQWLPRTRELQSQVS
jgi:hypothetical protein